MGLITLKKRAQFLAVRGGARWATPAFVLESKPRTGLFSCPEQSAKASNSRHHQSSDNKSGRKIQPDDLPMQSHAGPPQFGITITKRIGNAVTRNLIRRRLKEALRQLAPAHARPGHDYVVIARDEIVNRSFVQLTQELKTALERIHSPGHRVSRSRRRQKRSEPGSRPGSKSRS